MPLLGQIYRDGYLGSLSALAEEFNQLHALVRPLFARFHAQVHRSQIACWFDCSDFISQPLFFEGGASRNLSLYGPQYDP